MGGGGGGDSTTTVYTKSDPWEGVQQYLSSLYGDVANQGQTPVSPYPGQTWVPMSPLMRQGIESNIGYVNNELPNVYNAGVTGLNDLFGAMNVGNNPYVQGMNQALAEQTSAAGQQQIGQGAMQANRLLQNQAFTYNDMMNQAIQGMREQILPDIMGSYNSIGGLGGTRNALAQVGAVDQFGNDLQRMMRDVTQSQGQNYQDYLWGMGNMLGENQRALASGIAQQNLGAYGTGVNAVGTALGYLPQQIQMGMIPGQTYQQAGNIFEGYQNAALQDEVNKYNYLQNEPWNRYANMNAIYSGATPYASQNQTQTTPSTYSPWATAAGVGLGAYGLFS